jgi:hypothetical protein
MYLAPPGWQPLRIARSRHRGPAPPGAGKPRRQLDSCPRRHDRLCRARTAAKRPQPRELHITGMDAIRLANEANRASSALPPLRELESSRKRYRRP